MYLGNLFPPEENNFQKRIRNIPQNIFSEHFFQKAIDVLII